MSIVKDAFFGSENVSEIQNQIVMQIYSITGKKIPFQKPESVYTVMRYTFTNYSLNSCDIENELPYLNKKCLDILIPNILNSMEQYLNYMKLLKEDTRVLDYPKQTTNKRSEENKSFDYTVTLNNSVDSIFR